MSTRFGEWFNPKPFWFRLLLIVAVVIISSAGMAAWMIVSDRMESDEDDNTSGAASVTATVDKCQIDSDGWLEAGGMVINRGDDATNVKVMLIVDGEYVDFDYVMDVGAGDSASWSINEPDVSRRNVHD